MKAVAMLLFPLLLMVGLGSFFFPDWAKAYTWTEIVVGALSGGASGGASIGVAVYPVSQWFD